MIAYTNHALDHMLSSVLDAGITSNIVRLGSRSSDERISQYSIETRERVTEHSRLDRTVYECHRELKNMEDQINKLMERILKADLESDSSEVMKYIMLYHPEHCESLSIPPDWITASKELSDDSSDGPWQVQGPKGHVMNQDTSMYAYWKKSGDLLFLSTVETPTPTHVAAVSSSSTTNPFQLLSSNTADSDTSDTDSDSDDDDSSAPFEDLEIEEIWMMISDYEKDEDEEAPQESTQLVSEPLVQDTSPEVTLSRDSYVRDPSGFFRALGEESIPTIPSSDRELDDLFQDGNVWQMSTAEREHLHKFWIGQARIEMNRNQLEEFEQLRARHAEKRREYNECKETVRYLLLTPFVV